MGKSIGSFKVYHPLTDSVHRQLFLSITSTSPSVSGPTIITAAASDKSIPSSNSDKPFIFGVATAAYQIEGAYNEDGRGLSVWDEFSHRSPSPIVDQSTGDVAADSYHNMDRDLRLLEELGVQSYRFSISWSRILPLGDATKINLRGLQYYSTLIDQLIARKIIPFVTLFHWDSPLELQKIGGWTNKMMGDYFLDYARILFVKFGGRVKNWITFNEPNEFCGNGYGSKKVAPGMDLPGEGDYACMHNVLISHARIYKMYQREFLESQGGEIGITLNNRFVYQRDPPHHDLVDRYMAFTLGWKMDPLFDRPFHGYPAEMKAQIESNSRAEGRFRSRLPEFSKEEKEELFNGKIVDFLGLNYYTSRMLSPGNYSPADSASYDKDVNLTLSHDVHWIRAKSEWLYSVPQGLFDLLAFIKDRYNNPKVYITENGWSDNGQLDDYAREVYLENHLKEVKRARDGGSDLQGYFHWSLMDNFEWERGYT